MSNRVSNKQVYKKLKTLNGRGTNGIRITMQATVKIKSNSTFHTKFMGKKDLFTLRYKSDHTLPFWSSRLLRIIFNALLLKFTQLLTANYSNEAPMFVQRRLSLYFDPYCHLNGKIIVFIDSFTFDEDYNHEYKIIHLPSQRAIFWCHHGLLDVTSAQMIHPVLAIAVKYKVLYRCLCGYDIS